MVAKKCKRSRRNRSRKQRRSRKQQRSRRQSQRGGMAPFDAPYQSMSDSAARAMAGVASLDSSIAELPSVIPRQSGGSELAPFRGGRRRRRSNRKSRRSRKSQKSQRGGMSPIDAPSVYIRSPAGVNPQFAEEGAVNSLYSASRGAQGY